ncbi:MAG: hypothetical protein V3571_11040 [Pseudodesulfovibrio sp.]
MRGYEQYWREWLILALMLAVLLVWLIVSDVPRDAGKDVLRAGGALWAML